MIYDNATDLKVLELWLPLDDSLYKNGKIIIITSNDGIQDLCFPFEIKTIKVPYLLRQEKETLFYCIYNKSTNIVDKSFIKSALDQAPSTPAGVYSVVNNQQSIKPDVVRPNLKLISMKGEAIRNLDYENLTEKQEKMLDSKPYEGLFDSMIDGDRACFDMSLLLCLLNPKKKKKKVFLLAWLFRG